MMIQRTTDLAAPRRSQDGAESASTVVVTDVRSVTLWDRIIKADARIARLEADLSECLDYFKDRYDVVDGDYGEPRANREMQLGTMLDETLNGRDF